MFYSLVVGFCLSLSSVFIFCVPIVVLISARDTGSILSSPENSEVDLSFILSTLYAFDVRHIVFIISHSYSFFKEQTISSFVLFRMSGIRGRFIVGLTF